MKLRELKSGTIVLFERQPKCLSKAIGIITQSHWTHAGIVLRNEEHCYLLESVLNLGQLDMPLTDGVTLTEIGKRLSGYGGDLKFLVPKNLRSGYEKDMWDWYEKNKLRRFDKLFFITYFSRHDREAQYFCSELVADVLKCVGAIGGKKASHRFSPGDFDEMGRSGKLEEVRGVDLAARIVEAHSALFGRRSVVALAELLLRASPGALLEMGEAYARAVQCAPGPECIPHLLGCRPPDCKGMFHK